MLMTVPYAGLVAFGSMKTGQRPVTARHANLTYNAQTAEMTIASRLEVPVEAQPLCSRRATEQFA